MSIGVASSDCEGSQETNSNNLIIYDSLLPLISSQEDEIINNLPEYWCNSTNYQVEPVILPTHDHVENGSCSSNQMISLMSNHMMDLPLLSLCEWEGQNLFTGSGPQECLMEGLLNQETFFDNSSLFGWLPQYASY